MVLSLVVIEPETDIPDDYTIENSGILFNELKIIRLGGDKFYLTTIYGKYRWDPHNYYEAGYEKEPFDYTKSSDSSSSFQDVEIIKCIHGFNCTYINCSYSHPDGRLLDNEKRYSLIPDYKLSLFTKKNFSNIWKTEQLEYAWALAIEERRFSLVKGFEKYCYTIKDFLLLYNRQGIKYGLSQWEKAISATPGLNQHIGDNQLYNFPTNKVGKTLHEYILCNGKLCNIKKAIYNWNNA